MREGEELKAPRHASAAATRDGNLPHVTATCHTWRQYASYSDHLPLFPIVTDLILAVVELLERDISRLVMEARETLELVEP
jgi:hypothetical protein